jgi:serine/threonine-protein kinase
MEYVEGRAIDEYCDHRSLSIPDRLKLFQKLCSAVEYAHRNLIVHRDIKPGNVLVTGEGIPKLLDFGIAKLVNPVLSGEGGTLTGLAMTPEYASPEQARGEPVTTVSDVYSLGVLLYVLLTGHLPYRFKTRQPLEILRAVCEDEPEKPSTAVGRTEQSEDRVITAEEVCRTREASPEQLKRRLSGDLDTILLMALRKEPSRRYQSVEALSEDLRRYLEARPIKARKATFSYRTGKFLRRNWAGVSGTAVVIVLVVGFSASTVVQSRRLRKESDKASRVSSFLVDLFKVSDPGEARGNTVTAREILDKGADKIRGELKEEPEVQATLMDTMGTVYESLGLYDRAEGLLRDSLGIRRRVLGSEHSDVATSLRNLAHVLLNKGDYTGAEALYRESLVMSRKAYGNEHPDVASNLSGLGSVLDRKGDYGGAEALYREALAMRRRLLGNEHPKVAESLSDLAAVLDESGRDYAGAEALDREALAIFRKLLGNDHPSVAITLTNLAVVLDDKGDYAGAVPLYREALAMSRKLHGNEHPSVATILTNLAVVLNQEGDHVEAEAIGREAVAMWQRLLGSKHPFVASTMMTLGHALHDQGKLPEAEEAFRESLEIRRKALPPQHVDTAYSLVGLAEVLAEEGRTPQAEAMLREGLEIQRKALPNGHPDIAEAESDLAACLIRMHRFEEAESLLLGSYPILRAKQGAGKATGDARQHLIDLYTAWGRPDKAREYAATPASPSR